MKTAAYLALAFLLIRLDPQPWVLGEPLGLSGLNQPIYQNPIYQDPIYNQPTLDQPTLNESVLCEARRLFNPYLSKTMDQLGKAPVSEYVNARFDCTKRAISRLEDVTSIAGDKLIVHQEYDSKSRLVQMVTFSQDTTRFAYDQSGHLIRIDQAGKITQIEYKADKHGNYSYSRMITPDHTYTCQVQGLTTEETRHDKGQLAVTIRKQFDKHKRLVRIHTVPEKQRGNQSLVTYEYDPKGQCVKQITQSGDGQSGDGRSEGLFEYDPNGFLTKVRVVADGKAELTRTYAYAFDTDGKNTSIRQTEFFDGVPTHPVTYIFDEYGNWIIRDSTRPKGFTNIEERKIVYR